MDRAAYIRQVQTGVAAAQRGDFEKARAVARSLLTANRDDPNAMQIIGLGHAVQGRPVEALDAYLKADARAPGQPLFLNMIGVLYRQLGDLARARDYLERAVKSAPDFIAAHYNLGGVLAAVEDRAGARRHYLRAVELGPNNADALARYAEFLEKTHDLEGARSFAERALAASPRHPLAQITLAEIEARQGLHEAVVARLAGYLEANRPDAQNGAIIFGRLAKSLEKLERFDEAFAAFSKSNHLHKHYYADFVVRQQTPRAPDRLMRVRRFLEATDPAGWTRFDALDGDDPVFLVGFPRSGTTMLDQILSSHPGVCVLEEKETLADACMEFIIGDRLDRLPGLGREEIEKHRALYWRRVREAADDDGRLFVDKLPLNAALVGFIHRFFPQAKFIFAIRDPRDAVFSCFQQTFSMNAAMYQFLELDAAARYYDLVMGLAARAREKFPLDVHEVRYERVVDDLDAEIAPLLAFLGLDWRDGVRAFYETARARAIRTPSAKQVIQKPYKSSIGKWRAYEKHMAPVLPVLDPWAERFGYEG